MMAWISSLSALIAMGAFVFSVLKWWLDGKAEKQTVTRALLAEVDNLIDSVERRYRWWTDPARVNATHWLPPLMPFYADAYDHLVQKLGLLPKEVAHAIVVYHGYLRFLNGLAAARAEYQSDQTLREEFHRIYRRTLEEQRERGTRFRRELAGTYLRLGAVPAEEPTASESPGSAQSPR